MQTEVLYQSLVAAFNADQDDPAGTARAITGVLCAFAAVIAGPPATVEGVELVADDTQELILVELQGLRADLAAYRSGASRITASVINTPPPVGAKSGRWFFPVAGPKEWIESRAPEYDPATPEPAFGEQAPTRMSGEKSLPSESALQQPTRTPMPGPEESSRRHSAI